MKKVFLFSVMLACYIARAQDPEMVRMLEDQADRDGQVEREEDLQGLQQYRRRPLILNLASAEELALFPFLTSLHVEQFLMYRKFLGPLTAIEELQAIPGWEPQVIRNLLPYVAVAPPGTIGTQLLTNLQKADQQLLLRWSSQGAALLRYRLHAASIGINFTLEKDRGEAWWQGQKGLAFASAHVVVRNLGLVRQWVMGDFLVNLGQGLLLWQGRGLYKSSMAVMIKRQQALVQPYRSADENRFMRGSAVWLARKRWQAMAFVSRHGLDANIVMDSSAGRRWVSSFQTSGLHQTPAALADRDALQWTSAGGAIRYQGNRFSAGLHGLWHRFSLPIQKQPEPYNLFAFTGRRLRGIGTTLAYSWRGIHGFAELAWDGRKPAGLGGVMIAADRNLDVSILFRYADRAFHAYGTSAFMENEAVNNEMGTYLGFSWRPSGKVTLDGYLDRFSFPWLKYRVNEPSAGWEQLLQLTWKPDRQTRLIFRWKQLEKTENAPGSAIIRKSLSTERSAFRLHVEHTVSPQLEWRGRVELVTQTGVGVFREAGFMGFIECHWLWKQLGISGNGRLGLFHTTSYDTRIYAYEADVMYYSTIPASFGRGAQLFFNLRRPIGNKLNIYIKCSNAWQVGIAVSYIRGQLVWDF